MAIRKLPAGLFAAPQDDGAVVPAVGDVADDFDPLLVQPRIDDDNWEYNRSGSWSDAADWSTGAVPESTTQADISIGGGYAITIGSPAVAASIELLTSASIVDSSSLTLDGGVDYNGILDIEDGRFTLAAGGTLTFNGEGNGVFVDTNGLFVDDTATLAGTAENLGTIDFAARQTTITGYVTNDGTINFGSGQLILEDGGTFTGMVIGSGALVIEAEPLFSDLTDVSGAGSIVVDSGAALVLGDSSGTISKPLTLAGGGLNFGPSLTISNALTFSGDAYIVGESGTPTFTTTGNVTIMSADTDSSISCDWQNFGTVDDGGGLDVSDSFDTFAFNNIGAVINLTSNNATLTVEGAADAFTNAGLIDKTGGSGASFIDSDILNTGTIEASIGTLVINCNSAISGVGSMVAGVGATIDIGNAYGLSDGGTLTQQISGAGTLEIGAGSANYGSVVFVVADGYAPDVALVQVEPYNTLDLYTGGSVLGSISGDGTLQLDGADYTLAGDTSDIATLQVDDGATLSGTGLVDGDVTDDGSIEASGGTLSISSITGTGTLSAGTGSVLNLSGGGTLTEAISGDGTLHLETDSFTLDAATLAIAALVIGEDATLEGNGTVTGSVTDNGTIDASDGALKFTAAIGGDGTLSAEDGAALELTFGGTLSLPVSGDGTLQLVQASFSLAGGTLDIANVAVDSATLTGTGLLEGDVFDGGTVNASGGTLQMAGDVTGNGILSAAAGAVLELDDGGMLTEATTGAGTLLLERGSYTDTGVNLGIAQLTLDAGASFSGRIDVHGKVADAGTVTASGGELELADGVSGTGTLSATAGAVLDLQGGAALTESINGAGTLQLDGGSFSLAKANVGIAHVTVDRGATLSGFGQVSGHLVDTGAIAASGGTLLLSGPVSGKGMLTAAMGAVLELTQADDLTEAISGAGTLRLTAEAVYDDTAAITVGTLSLTSTGSLSGYGTITGAVSDGGTIVASSHTLLLGGAIGGGGTLSVAAGAVLDLAGGGNFGGTILGAGTVDIAGKTALLGSASLSATKVIETANLTLGVGISLATAAAHDFTLTASSGTTVTLGGASGDSFTNTGSLVANGAGTAQIGVGFINAANVTASSGTLAFLGGVSNNGTIDAAGATISFADTVGGFGTLDLGTAGTLSLLAGSGTGQTVDFLGATGLLELAKPLDFSGEIAGFRGADQIDLVNTAETGFGYANGTLTVMNGQKTVASLLFTGTYSKANFVLGPDNHTGTLITFT
jgi:hypothetical protein